MLAHDRHDAAVDTETLLVDQPDLHRIDQIGLGDDLVVERVDERVVHGPVDGLRFCFHLRRRCLCQSVGQHLLVLAP
ncbi:hypothetical protein AJ88_45075 [Mesorhizobium amorphae CCBAU 01583]|nr:hypothetical protein AJ88_45075 [Mesorhizobium amorphae CCBAU 01583]